MEAFTIICDTCAAKLKVRNAKLIGQKLGCPKCGSMLTVDAPEGWIPEPHNTNATAVSESSDTDFDDIDAILKQQSAGPSKKGKRAATTGQKLQSSPPRNKPPSQLQKHSPPQAATKQAEPILPDDNWTAASTKSNRKLVTIVAISIGALILVTAGILAVTANRKGEEVALTSSAADTTIDNSDADTPEIAEPDKATQQPSSNENPNESDGSDTKDLADMNSASNGSDVTEPEEPKTEVDEPNNTTDSTPEIPETPIETPVPDPPNETKRAASPFDEVFDEILNPKDGQTKNVKTNFDELSDALENAGTTISEINQFASIKRRRVGTPKYFVQRNILEKPQRNPLGLELPCGGAQYKDLTLNQVIADIEQITGTPISLDADALDRISFDYGKKIELLLKEQNSFLEVLEKAANAINKNIEIRYSGGIQPATLSAMDENTPAQLAVPMPGLKEMSSDDLMSMLRDLVAPGTWGKENKIEFTENQLQATHLPRILAQLEQFIKKWNAAVSNPGNAALEELRSKHDRTADALSRPINANFNYATPIRQFMANMERQTDLNILVDFGSLLDDGWNPRSTMPPNITESNIGDLLDELCHSMKIAYRVVNKNTIELLSIEAEKQHRDVEFYNCAKILEGPLDINQMIQLLRQSLQAAGFTADDMRAYYANEIDCFIVLAPQSIQRTIESILKRLEQL